MILRQHRGGGFLPPRRAGILSQEPAEERAEGHEDAMRHAERAIARAEDTSAYAESVLAHLYLIRDRLDSMERETSDLAARSRLK
jgi:hypothetical protein